MVNLNRVLYAGGLATPVCLNLLLSLISVCLLLTVTGPICSYLDVLLLKRSVRACVCVHVGVNGWLVDSRCILFSMLLTAVKAGLSPSIFFFPALDVPADLSLSAQVLPI